LEACVVMHTTVQENIHVAKVGQSEERTQSGTKVGLGILGFVVGTIALVLILKLLLG